MDKLQRDARRIFKGTDLYEVRSLLAEQTKWQRKLTIARNKLASVRRKLDDKAEALAAEKLHKHGLEDA